MKKTQTQKGKRHMISCIKFYNLELTEVESTMEASEPCGGEGGDEDADQKVQTPSQIGAASITDPSTEGQL